LIVVTPPPSTATLRSDLPPDAHEQIRVFWDGPATASLQGVAGWALVPNPSVAEVLCLADIIDDGTLITNLVGDPLKPVVFLGARRANAEFAVDDGRSARLTEVLAEARAAAVLLRTLRSGAGAGYAADLYRLALAFAFTRSGRVRARIGAHRTGGFGYDCDFALGIASRGPADAMPVLASLAASGYVSEQLAEVAHACPSCHGIQLMLRDSCPGCGSPDLSTVPIVHHFRCSYQAPETEFLTQGRVYLCPKCRRELRHFGLDYDKPGDLTVCGACGHRGSETVVRGSCLSCRHDFAAGDSPRLRICDYRLTDAGLHAVMSGQARVFDPLRLLGETLTIVPLETLFLSVRQFAALEERRGVKSLVLTLRLERAIVASAGSGEEISLLLAIGSELVRHLRESDVAAYDRGTLFVLLPGAPLEVSAPITSRLATALRSTFKDAIVDQLRFESVGAADFLKASRSASS
jgi:hypothetical protein